MEILEQGSRGEMARAWQYYLLGQGLYRGTVDGVFGQGTAWATRRWRIGQGLADLPVLDDETRACAVARGFTGAELDWTKTGGVESATWPPPPGFPPLTAQERQAMFGAIEYVAQPSRDCPEAIKITNAWSHNVEMVEIPQLTGLPGAGTNRRFPFHTKIAAQVVKLFQTWEDRGFKPFLLGFGGSWAPRFKRGSKTDLSAHAWATAFDINVPWNLQGKVPALVGQQGSVRELVAAAHELGFYWGGHFPYPDGMHFEAARLIDP